MKLASDAYAARSVRSLSPASQSGSEIWLPTSLDSRNPPLHHLALRAVQVVSKAREVAEQQLLAQIHETQLADDPFPEFQDVRAFFESTTTCSACVLELGHEHEKAWWFMKVEPV